MGSYFVSDIEFEVTELLETISVHDQTYLAIGYNSKGYKYEGTAHVSCGEIVKVTDIQVCNKSDFITSKNMNDNVLGHLREARAILNDETKEGKGSREVALVITKIDEALLWRQEVLRLRQPIENHTDK